MRLWVPEGNEPIRALIVLTMGQAAESLSMVEDPDWQQCATAAKSALLGVTLKGVKNGHFLEADKWSGKTLLTGLKALAKDSQHPELAELPLAFWGNPGGAQFVFSFARWKADRTLAFVSDKSDAYDKSVVFSTRNVPALLITGEKDTPVRLKETMEIFGDQRKKGAVWGWLNEAAIGHNVSQNGRNIARIFLEEVIVARVGKGGTPAALTFASGWQGDLKTGEIKKAEPTAANNPSIAWFPGEKTAMVWKNLQTPPQPAAAK